MDDFQPGRVVGLAFQLFAQEGFVTGEDELQVGILGQGGQGARYGCLGAVVAAEAVYDKFDHKLFT